MPKLVSITLDGDIVSEESDGPAPPGIVEVPWYASSDSNITSSLDQFDDASEGLNSFASYARLDFSEYFPDGSPAVFSSESYHGVDPNMSCAYHIFYRKIAAKKPGSTDICDQNGPCSSQMDLQGSGQNQR